MVELEGLHPLEKLAALLVDNSRSLYDRITIYFLAKKKVEAAIEIIEAVVEEETTSGKAAIMELVKKAREQIESLPDYPKESEDVKRLAAALVYVAAAARHGNVRI